MSHYERKGIVPIEEVLKLIPDDASKWKHVPCEAEFLGEVINMRSLRYLCFKKGFSKG